MSQAVLAMYDFRGIQDYIYKTNAMKEIRGASHIVEDLFNQTFGGVFEKQGDGFLKSWCDGDGRPLPYRFDGPDVQTEVLSVGGGNLLAAFKDEEACRRFNRVLTKLVMDKAYSLQVAIAVAPMTDDYRADYKHLKEVMGRIKAQNRRPLPAGGCPFTKIETTTGLPVTITEVEFEKPVDRSTESRLKRAAFEHHQAERGEFEKIIDNLVTEKGVESLIAVVHIDGNSVGRYLLDGLSGFDTYEKAIPRLREMSANIRKCFNKDAVESVLERVGNEKRARTDEEGRKRLMFMPVVLAGDDVTFVCNAQDALTLTEIFLEAVEKGTLYEGAPHFTACAGICYVHSHFPFRIAYELAEDLTDSAKRVGKENLDDIRSAVDFHLAMSGVLDDLEAIRIKEYTADDRVRLTKRPYLLGDGPRSLGEFKLVLDRAKPIPRSWLKRARDAHHEGVQAAEDLAAEAASRGYNLVAKGIPLFENGVANCYDALEFMDIAYGRA